MLEVEEDFLSLGPSKITENGIDIGLCVKPVGDRGGPTYGVYAMTGKRIYGRPGDLLAVRPDKKTAIAAALQLANQQP